MCQVFIWMLKVTGVLIACQNYRILFQWRLLDLVGLSFRCLLACVLGMCPFVYCIGGKAKCVHSVHVFVCSVVEVGSAGPGGPLLPYFTTS